MRKSSQLIAIAAVLGLTAVVPVSAQTPGVTATEMSTFFPLGENLIALETKFSQICLKAAASEHSIATRT